MTINPNNNGGNFIPLGLSLGQTPDCKIGRRAIRVAIDFSQGTTFTLDLTQVQAAGAMDSLQTLYVDNSANTFNVTILTGVLQQSIVVYAGAQGYIPILQTNPPIVQFTTAGGTAKFYIHVLNFFVPPQFWYTTGFPVTDVTLASVISNGGVNVNSTPVTLTGEVDASGTITVGGTKQTLFASDAARKKWILSNPSTATEILQFSYGGTTHYIDLPPGATWVEDNNAVSGDEIDVVAATAGHAFTAYRWG